MKDIEAQFLFSIFCMVLGGVLAPVFFATAWYVGVLIGLVISIGAPICFCAFD
jgi:hypothetical protein